MLDGNQVNVGDYVVGQFGTYFIVSKQRDVPIESVNCNRVVSLTQGGTSPVAVGWPASVLLESPRGNEKIEDIPGGASTPHFWVLLPAISGVTIDVADLLTDDMLRAYFITAAELTDLGWRISAQLTTNLSDSIRKHYATIIERIGKVVTLRQVSTITGKAASSYAIGTTTISLTSASGSATAGDTFGTFPNTLTNTVAPTGGVLTNITFTPGLTADLTLGQTVTLSHNTDSQVKALIQSYDLSLIASSVVQLTDMRLILDVVKTNGSSLPVPVTTNFLVFDGKQHTILSAKSEYAGDTVIIYDIQAKA